MHLSLTDTKSYFIHHSTYGLKESEKHLFCNPYMLLHVAAVAAASVFIAIFLLKAETKRRKKKAVGLTVSQVEVVRGSSRPQPHGIYSVVHVARDGRVVRHRQHHLHRKQ